jgi:hypothetical protein
MTESTIQSRILRTLGSRPDIRLFRNQVGAAYVGHKLTDLSDARFIRYGLTPGSGDLIGWKSVTVTPDMVGRRLAVFLSVEVKTATGRPKPEQVTWKNRVNEFGGIAVIARSEEEAMNSAPHSRRRRRTGGWMQSTDWGRRKREARPLLPLGPSTTRRARSCRCR